MKSKKRDFVNRPRLTRELWWDGSHLIVHDGADRAEWMGGRMESAETVIL